MTGSVLTDVDRRTGRTDPGPQPWWRRTMRSGPVWLAVAVLVGVLLRVARWSDGRSLNSDELWVALSLYRRTFAQIPGPLDYDQLAPLGWLWLEKAVMEVSRDDAALRLPSLVAGCVVVGLSGVLARRLLPAPLAVASVALVAGGPVLIYQSSQLKQYSFEAAASLLLVLLAGRVLDRPGRRSAAAFWLTGAVAVWFATTAVFVLAAAGGLLVAFDAVDRRWDRVRANLVAAVPAVLSVAAVRLTAPPPAQWLYAWWSERYPGSLAPRPIDLPGVVRWTAQLANRFRVSALGVESRALGALVLLLLAAGVVTVLLRTPRHGALLVAPLVAGYLLALLRLYPMASRVSLWLVPLALLLVCAGVDGVVRGGRRLLARRLAARRLSGRGLGDRGLGGRGRLTDTAEAAMPYAAAVGLVLLLLPHLGRAPDRTNADRYVTAEEAVRFVAERRRPGDRVLTHAGDSTSALVLWYGPAAGLRPDGEYTGARRGCPPAWAAELAGAPAVWLVRVSWAPRNQARRDPERAAMSRYGRLAGEHWFGGVVVLHFRPAPQPARIGAACLVTRPFPG